MFRGPKFSVLLIVKFVARRAKTLSSGVIPACICFPAFWLRLCRAVLTLPLAPETSVPDTVVLHTSCSYNRIRSHGRESAPSVTPASRKIRATVAAISGAPGVSP